MKKFSKKICVLSITTLALCFHTSRGQTAGIVISEVMAHPSRDGNTSASDEYIEICNASDTVCDLSDCMIATPGGRRQELVPWNGSPSGIEPGHLLEPGAIAIITASGYSGRYRDAILRTRHAAGRIHMMVTGSRLGVYGLSDNGGAILLENGSGQLLDIFVWYEDAGENVSWERDNPLLKSASLVRRFNGGTPGIASLPIQSRRPPRFALEQALVKSGQPAIAILTLKTGEKAEVRLHTLDGRCMTTILKQVDGPGIWRIPIARYLDDGRRLPAGRYLLSSSITGLNGEKTHVTKILRLAPLVR